jgi:colicin import membrane protein
MKRNFLVIALLLSILCWGVNAAAFAQNQDKKDTKIQEVKKDVIKKGDIKKQEVKKDVIKKSDTKKEEMIKKGDTKKEEMMKKGDTKKEEMMKKHDVKKEEMIKKSDTKKEEMLKKHDVKKEEMKKDVKDVKTVVKDKEVGKTADGKTIYEGPKGGKYTLGANGKKVYIKKDAK